jgi:RHS repeat-associated protein
VDFLDNGSLTLQYNRHRYYDYYTGRWTTQDPLGISANSRGSNRYRVLEQYADSLNLYAYAGVNPVIGLDAWGLMKCSVTGKGTFRRAETDPWLSEFYSQHVLNYRWKKEYECSACNVDSGDEKVTYSNVEHVIDSISLPPVIPIGITAGEEAVVVEEETHEVSRACRRNSARSGTKHLVTLVIGDELSASISFIWTWESSKIVAKHRYKFWIDCCCIKPCGSIRWVSLPQIYDPAPGEPATIGPASAGGF